MLTSFEKTLLGFIIVFFASALWPKLPHYSLIAFVFLLFLFCFYYKFSAFLNGLLLGFLWACLSIHYYLDAQIDATKFNQNLIVEGEVASIVHNPDSQVDALNDITNVNIKFNFLVNTMGTEKQWLKPQIRIAWYKPSIQIYQGQKLRLFIRLKAPFSLGNPHIFNYQQWLASKNIVATAYVINSVSNRLVENTQSLRQSYIQRLLQIDAQYMPWILALSFGDRSLLSKDDWQLMQTTGTAHLFAISGMHLGIVFGFVFIVLKILLFLPLRMLNNQISITPILLAGASIMSCFYAFIAGLEIPVMRALIALLIWFFLSLLGLHWRTTSVFILLLAVFVLLFPFAHLGLSFWFSFGAVLLIILFTWRFPMSRIKHAESRTSSAILINSVNVFFYSVRLQLFLSFATIPIIAWAFGLLPLSGFIANLFMIPVVTFIFVPICLLTTILISFNVDPEFLVELLNALFNFALNVLLQISFWFEQFSISWSITLSELAFCMCLIFSALLPQSQIRIKWFCATILLVAITFNSLEHDKLKSYKNKWELLAFDVGQGTSIVINRQSKYFIYDTGPSYRNGFTMAQAALLPYFEHKGMPSIDYLVISHFDNDHSGGAKFLEQNMQISQTLTPANGCHSYQHRKWHGLHLEVLWPLSPQTGDENNHSCVIKLSSESVSILLAGDIEKSAEAAIVKTYLRSSHLQADILIAPHHGSKTSSTKAFVQAVAPSYIVFTAGYNNRWGFPAKQIMARYTDIGAQTFNTGTDGRILIQIDKNKIKVSRYRKDELQRWYFQARDYNTL